MTTIIKIDEVKGHVEFSCADGVKQKAQDLFAPTAEGIKEKVVAYCELYSSSVDVVAKIESKEVTKMRALEGKAVTLAEVVTK